MLPEHLLAPEYSGMANETAGSCDDLLELESPGTAGASGFARIVDAMLLPPSPARKRRPARRAPPPADDAAQTTPAAALDRAQALIRSGQLDAGLTLCHRVWPVVAEAGDVTQMALCQSTMLLGYHYKGMCRAAAAAGRLGLSLLDRTGDHARKLYLMSQLAVSLAQVGLLTEAFETLYKGAQLLPAIQSDPLLQCRFWSNAAATYGILNLNDDAMACALKAAALAELIDDPVMVTTTRSNSLFGRLTMLAEQPASWQELQPVYREMLAQLDEVIAGGRQHLMLALVGKGADALIAAERWDEARSLLHVGRTTALAAGMGPTLAQVERRLAAVERLTGHLRLAGVHAREAVALATQQQAPEIRADAYLESSLVFEAQGHWQHALLAFRNYARERDAWNATQTSFQWRAWAHRLNQVREQRRDPRDRPPDAGDFDDKPAITPVAEPFARESFEQSVARWREDPSALGPLVVMIGGVDELVALRSRLLSQRVNDAIRRIGRLLEQHLRPGDLYAAWDGEQYAVAFRLGTSLESALEVAHRLCTLAGTLDWEDVAPGVVMSASFGLAVFGASEDLETALLRADWALHGVRHEGRGRARAIW